jgi:predicted nucleic acid-binding Zn ribbon protein
MNEFKTCPYCLSEIPAEAVKCSHCSEWLNKRELSLGNPYFVGIMLMVIGFCVIFGLQMNIRNKFATVLEEKFDAKTTKIKILKHQKQLKPKVTVVGKVKNEDGRDWNGVSIKVIAYDKDEKSFYIGDAYLSNLKKGDEKYFQVNFGCSEDGIDETMIDHYEIGVESAY